MSLAYFIARRIHFSKGDSDASQRVSPPAIRIAIAGIAIGLAVMILSVAIVVGFKHEVREKVIGFGSHIQISAFTSNTTFETQPICVSDTLLDLLKSQPGIRSAQAFATKPAILKTDNDFLSIVIKGMTSDSNLSFFANNLVEGSLPQYAKWGQNEVADDDESGLSIPSSDVLISRIIADKLQLNIDDYLQIFFIKNESKNSFSFGADNAAIRSRRLHVTGIYETHFDEYDSQFIVADLHLLQDVSGWDSDEASGIELTIDDFDQLETQFFEVYDVLNTQSDRKNNAFYIRTIAQLNPQIFSWLDLLDTNVWVILILITLVASFTMISGVLIIILERTTMIGVLKALGYDNGGIRKVFLYVALFLTGKGLIWGNVIGISLCIIQKYGHIISLDPKNYYLAWVPIELNPIHIILLNIGTIIITFLVLLGPSALVASIRPSKAIQSE